MTKEERQSAILDQLLKQGSVLVSALSDNLQQPGIAEDRRRAPRQRILTRHRPVAARRARIARDEVRHFGQKVGMVGRRYLAARYNSNRRNEKCCKYT